MTESINQVEGGANEAARILRGDCLERLRELAADSLDSLVTDPPAGISFMGKAWDDDKGGRREWIAWLTEVMRECYRVLKPGAHGLVWALPRTSHWTATALEDAGFEVRDVVTHLFGSGFPKSLDVSKAIDKAAGIEREVLGHSENARPNRVGKPTKLSGLMTIGGEITAPATDAAKAWQGWGTALKPASEHWILVRKPLSEKTVAANVLKWGTGALNIDASRIESVRPAQKYTAPDIRGGQFNANVAEKKRHDIVQPENLGRFPANLVLSHSPYCTDEICDLECAIKMLDEQSGTLKSGANPTRRGADKGRTALGEFAGQEECAAPRGVDIGGASRFFYCAKISKSERNAGLEGMPEKSSFENTNGCDLTNGTVREKFTTAPSQNFHPTVKPKKLMTYLIRMLTPTGGGVIDPFMGSGSTGVAAVSEGFRFIGIERELEYFAIAERRIFHAFPEFEKQVHNPAG
jgi:DNA modification methylase